MASGLRERERGRPGDLLEWECDRPDGLRTPLPRTPVRVLAARAPVLGDRELDFREEARGRVPALASTNSLEFTSVMYPT